MYEMRLDQNQTSVALSIFGANIAARGSSFQGGRGSRPFLPLNTIEEGGVASTLLQHLAPSVNYARNQAMWPMIAISDTTMVFKGTRLLL